MDIVRTTAGPPVEINGDTPTLRLFSLLEVMAAHDRPFSLQELVDETGLPKPTLHRMLQQMKMFLILGFHRHCGLSQRSVGLSKLKI